MNRNANSHFALNPTNIDIPRSMFDRPFELKTSFSAGDIVPFYLDEVLPGDSHQIRTSKVIRMPSLVAPILDNIWLDTYYFFVPTRLTWEHWKEFNGENTESAWIPQTEYTVPQIKAPSGGWSVGTIADYFGLPTGVDNIQVSSLPFRAYALICNEWFRDQNLMDPLNIPVDDSTVTGVNTGTFVTDVAKGGLPYKACKYYDYFTGALPSPQKGPDVTLPLVGAGQWPVYTTNDVHATHPSGNYAYGIRLGVPNGSSTSVLSGRHNMVASDGSIGVSTSTSSEALAFAAPTNLWAYGVDPQVASVNQLRLAFQIQKFYEKLARGGSRYVEILRSHFGVTSPDARLQRPEYLGGNRIPIMVNQVVQTSGTDSTPQGNTAAYSLTSDSHGDFIKSFTEHGFIIGVMVARYDHTYQQGIERMWSRKTRFDYYWPSFANIGEMAILNKEIYANGTSEDDEVFGYQEAWADYRYKPNRVTGQMRSTFAQSLDSWHLGDDYSSRPSLSGEWIREDPSNIDRVIAVTSDVSHQFFGDIYVENRTTRAIPLYSIPGLIDHH